MSDKSFDLSQTYVFMADGGEGTVIDLSPTFWDELMSGDYRSDGPRLIGEGSGWMLSAYDMSADMPNWEMHPEGDEYLIAMSGSFEIVFDEEAGRRTLDLVAGQTCMVPRGSWHQQLVREPGRIIAITFGRGSQHRD